MENLKEEYENCSPMEKGILDACKDLAKKNQEYQEYMIGVAFFPDSSESYEAHKEKALKRLFLQFVNFVFEEKITGDGVRLSVFVRAPRSSDDHPRHSETSGEG